MRWDIFCRVIDNYGDIGVCWRLACNLAHGHGQQVRLWVDDLKSFAHVCRQVDSLATQQTVDGIEVLLWPLNFPSIASREIPDVIIEAFACDLPEAYITTMQVAQALRSHPLVWFNLDYLSAEAWVEGCHLLPSPQNHTALRKTFFFPGFTEKTGGILRESRLAQERQNFIAEGADWQSCYGITRYPLPENALQISLFCYENTALPTLIQVWQTSPQPIMLWVPEGLALQQITTILQKHLAVGEVHTLGQLTIGVLPFASQSSYDRLLWACDINFVRGEDSLVRGIWAERPLLWHIYPQTENSHMPKLEAFLQAYQPQGEDEQIAQSEMWWAWNLELTDLPTWQDRWAKYLAALPKLRVHAQNWAKTLAKQPDLTQQLLYTALQARAVEV